MQQMTDSLKDAIRSTFQVPVARVEIYNPDGSLSGVIEDVESVNLSVASSREILRTVKLTIDNSDSKYTPDPEIFEYNFFWYTKTMKIFFGYQTGDLMDTPEYLPQGEFTIEGIKATDDPEDNFIEIEGSDLKTKLVEDKFDDVFKLRGIAVESPDYSQYYDDSQFTASSHATGYLPEYVIDNDNYETSWRPSPTDTAPYGTLYMEGSFDINVVYIYWGEHSFDYSNRISYYLEHSLDAVNWYRIQDLNGLDENASLFGDVEHVFDTIHARYVRIMITGWSGQIQMRNVKTQHITSALSVDKVIKDVAFASGITKFRVPKTRRYIKEAMADIGDQKYKFIKKIATSIGWIEPQFDEEGYLTTYPRDINPVDIAWRFHVDTDNIFSFSPKFSTYNLANVIVVIYKSSSDKAIIGRAIDKDPNSPTSIYKPGMGRRVKVYENDSYDTQDKVDIYAQQKLYERTRFKHQTNLPVTGHPGLQVDDVVLVEIPTSRISELYVITGFDSDFDASSATYDTRIHISQLGTFNDEEGEQIE